MVDFASFQEDVYDETILPLDFKTAGQIVNTVPSPLFLS